jgi:excisionase family DNA binding protein
VWKYYTKGEETVDDETERKTRTIDEAAKVLGISRNSAYEAARTGELGAIRVRKRWLVPAATLDRMVSDKG